jgi:hypothetical protein
LPGLHFNLTYHSPLFKTRFALLYVPFSAVEYFPP